MIQLRLRSNIVNITFVILLVVGSLSVQHVARAYGECSEYGAFATHDYLTNRCKCILGYVFDRDIVGNLSCVSGTTYCIGELGFGASYNPLNGSCECMYGYVLGEDLLGRSQCITELEACKNQYGFNATNALGGKCECLSGSEFTQDDFGKITCVDCLFKYGNYSRYNSLEKRCECMSGYTLDETGRCVKKQNNVYFILKELYTEDQSAIIRSDFDYHYYLISYGSGCYPWSINQYLNQQIVVNLGTDFDIDVFDKIVLQDNNETCYITRVETVDETTTLEGEKADMLPSTLVPEVPSTGSSQTAEELVLVTPDPKVIAITEGRLLLQVEEGGRIWYVSPDTEHRYEVTFANALPLFKQLSLGISDADLAKIAEASETRSGDRVLAGRLRGKLLLQVEQGGRIWYVYPNTLKRHEVTWANLMDLFRSLALGITNTNLGKIQEGVLN